MSAFRKFGTFAPFAYPPTRLSESPVSSARRSLLRPRSAIKDDNLSAKFTRESLPNTAKSTKAGDEIQQGQQIQTFWRTSLDFIDKKTDNISTENKHTKQDTGRTKKMTRYEIARKAYENDEMEGSTFGQ